MTQTLTGFNLIIHPQGSLIVKQLEGDYSVLATSPFNLSRSGLNRFSIANSNLVVAIPDIEIAGQKIHFRDLQLQVNEGLINGDDVKLIASVTLTGQPKAMKLETRINANLSSLKGSFSINTSHKATNNLMATSLLGWQSVYDLDAGTLKIQAEGDFQSSGESFVTNARGSLSITDGTAHQDELILTGILVDLPFAISGDLISIGPGPMHIGEVDVGIPVTKIDITLETDGKIANVRNLKGKILAGEINIDSLDYDIDAETSEFSVGLHGIPLAEVLALEGDDVKGDGILDGEIRVAMRPAGIVVRGGEINSRAPGGKIRYNGALGDGGYAQLGIAIKALQNFNYSLLSTRPVYENGDLALNIRLEGSSPDVEKGRPIHFNLNINENIPALLESLQSADELEKRLRKKMSQPKK